MSYINKIVTLILLFSFLLSGVVLATIEKDSTRRKKHNNYNITPRDSAEKTGALPNDKTNQKRPSGYDNFIDKNNNGIDDRAEKKSSGKKKDNSSENPTSDSKNSLDKNGNNNTAKQLPDDSAKKQKNR